MEETIGVARSASNKANVFRQFVIEQACLANKAIHGSAEQNFGEANPNIEKYCPNSGMAKRFIFFNRECRVWCQGNMSVSRSWSEDRDTHDLKRSVQLTYGHFHT